MWKNYSTCGISWELLWDFFFSFLVNHYSYLYYVYDERTWPPVETEQAIATPGASWPPRPPLFFFFLKTFVRLSLVSLIPPILPPLHSASSVFSHKNVKTTLQNSMSSADLFSPTTRSQVMMWAAFWTALPHGHMGESVLPILCSHSRKGPRNYFGIPVLGIFIELFPTFTSHIHLV